ncbi:hypothetical protein C0995_010873 [Termitomyces sp. Mi166|nr:hypothetical protein C0995_010873 [Termitomyces sp. Mi166\
MGPILRAVKSLKKRVSLKVKCLHKAPQAKCSEGDLFSVVTDELYLPASSNIRAENPIGDDFVAVVTVSATGEGVHTRWVYSEDSAPISPQPSSLPAFPPSPSTLGSGVEENEKLTIRIPASKKGPIRIPVSKQHRSANSPAFHVSNGCSDTEVTEKLTITVPGSKKRSHSTDDEDALFVRHTRPRRFAPVPSIAFVVPAKPEGGLIYSGLNKYADPVVVTTSATGQGTHTRWIYPTDIVTACASASNDADYSGWDAEDEVSCGSESDVLEKKKQLTITLPPLKSLKRTRDTEGDEDCPARRTRTRSSASSSISAVSTTYSATSSNLNLVVCYGACSTLPSGKVVQPGKCCSKKLKRN